MHVITPRIGRVLMAAGRDATDVAITTSFGASYLRKFDVVTEEIPEFDRTRRFSAGMLREHPARRPGDSVHSILIVGLFP